MRMHIYIDAYICGQFIIFPANVAPTVNSADRSKALPKTGLMPDVVVVISAVYSCFARINRGLPSDATLIY